MKGTAAWFAVSIGLFLCANVSVTAISCYECRYSFNVASKSESSCLYPPIKVKIETKCASCRIRMLIEDGKVTLKRSCEYGLPKGVSPTDKCELKPIKPGSKSKECYCVSNHCNAEEITLLLDVVDCYKCKASYYKSQPIDDKDSCFEPKLYTPIRKYCAQCQVRMDTDTDSFTIERDCQTDDKIKSEQWQNTTDESRYFCNNATLCNNFNVEDTRQTKPPITQPQVTTTSTAFAKITVAQGTPESGNKDESENNASGRILMQGKVMFPILIMAIFFFIH